MADDNLGGEELYERFTLDGFEALINDQPKRLADWLEARSVSTGQSANLFLSQSIRAVYSLFIDHNEAGGVQVDFIRWIDHLVKDSLPNIRSTNAPTAAALAQALHREIMERLDGYTSNRDYRL